MTTMFTRIAAVGLTAAALTIGFGAKDRAEAHCGPGCGFALGVAGGALVGSALAAPALGYDDDYAPTPVQYYGRPGFYFGYGYGPRYHHRRYYDYGPRYYYGPRYSSCWRQVWYDRWGERHVRRVCR